MPTKWIAPYSANAIAPSLVRVFDWFLTIFWWFSFKLVNQIKSILWQLSYCLRKICLLVVILCLLITSSCWTLCTLLRSSCKPSIRKARNSWESCWSHPENWDLNFPTVRLKSVADIYLNCPECNTLMSVEKFSARTPRKGFVYCKLISVTHIVFLIRKNLINLLSTHNN